MNLIKKILVIALLMVIITGCTTPSYNPPTKYNPLIEVPDYLLTSPKALTKVNDNNLDYTTQEDLIGIFKVVNVNYSLYKKNVNQTNALIKIINDFNNTQTIYNESQNKGN